MPGQFRSLDLAIAANQAGLTLAYLPVLSGRVARDDACEFGALLNRLPTLVLAYCRSGLRSATLWALSQADRQAWPKLVQRAAQAGFNLSGVTPPTQTSHL